MTEAEIYQKVANFIQKWQGQNFEVTPDFSIKDELGADSVDVMEFILTVEDEFGIEIPDEDIDHLETVADVVAYVGQKVAGNFKH